jgi:hypothetical protein
MRLGSRPRIFSALVQGTAWAKFNPAETMHLVWASECAFVSFIKGREAASKSRHCRAASKAQLQIGEGQSQLQFDRAR